MTLAAFANLAEVIGALGVIAGLIFVGVQLRQHTEQMRREEANSAMTHGSIMRQAILTNRDVADLLIAGLGNGPLDPADELRLNAFFGEVAYNMLHVWDRTTNGLALPDEFARAIHVAAPALASARGKAWWARSRRIYNPAFVAALEAAFPAIGAVSKPDSPAAETSPG